MKKSILEHPVIAGIIGGCVGGTVGTALAIVIVRLLWHHYTGDWR